MKILHVITVVDDEYSYGGPLTVAVNQCRELRARGHDARIVAGWRGRGKPPTEIEGVPAHLFRVTNLVPGMRFSGLISPSLLRWLVRRCPQMDVLHIHLARDLVPLLAAAVSRLRRTPYVVQTHGMIVPDSRASSVLVDTLLTRRTLRSANFRYFLTQDERAALSSLLSDRYPLTRLVNGVPAQQQSPKDHAADQQTPIDVLFLARLHPRKRVGTFLDVARHVSARLGDKVHFSIVGSDDGDLPLVEKLMAESPNLRRHVTYEGSLDHTAALERLAQADVYVLPSVEEPFPMSMLEALSLGVPSICTSSCGIAPDLDRAGAAKIADPDAESLASAVEELASRPTVRQRYSELARQIARSEYSMSAVVNQLEDQYRSMSSSSEDTRSRPSILWVTNIPTPYRAPLWQALGELADLHVAFLARTEPGREWKVTLDTASHKVTWLEARVLRHMTGTTLYAPTLQLLRLIAQKPTAVVFDGWESPAYLVSLAVARALRVPVIASYRSTGGTHRFTRGPIPVVRRVFFKNVTIAMTAGPPSTKAVRSFGVAPDRIREVFNVVDVARFARACSLRAGQAGDPSGHRFLYVGQLIERKNLDSLLNAFHKMSRPSDTLELVGTGPQKSMLESTVGRLSLSRQVTFTGHLDNDALIEAYARADTFVLPSTEEVWGLVANEALAAGLRVVITSSCGAADSIADMRGVIVTEPDPDSIAAAMRRCSASGSEPIEDPEILKMTPHRAAGQLIEILLGLRESGSTL